MPGDYWSAEPIAYLNGEWTPFSQTRLPVYDLALVQGATLTERLRTVQHRPYLVEPHLQRLRRSLSSIGWPLPEQMGPMEQVIADLAEKNCRSLPASQDLSIVLFVTAGQWLGDANGLVSESHPTVCAYTAPLPLAAWARWHRQGVSLIIPQIRQPAADSLPSGLKHRSRLHWALAEQQVRSSFPGAMALLLDGRGFVTETSSGNFFIVRQNQLLTPRAEETLPGIAQTHVLQLAQRQGWEVQRADLEPADVAAADEAFLTSSTYCIAPVGEINGQRIGNGLPGRVTKMLMDAWSQEMGLDFVRQSLEAAESQQTP